MTRATHVIIGTAGHIDHGKTALVKALTGIETDTQPEEQARGVTIDVGFAYWKEDVTLIDVPGHERFVKNAVTGVCSVDLALFVVAADDGVMPQTREHLGILDLLGVRRGVVALTKVDLVEPEWVEMVEEELRELLAGTFLEAAEIVPVSAVTGEGVDRLRSVLEGEIAQVEGRLDQGAFRLPVDRVFTAPGFGTVVTGTVLSGRVQPRDELVLQPAGRTVRARGVQIHGRDQSAAGVGVRAAVNLSDAEVGQVERGDTLAEPGFFEATWMIDARLNMLAAAPAAVTNRDRVRLHLGPREVLARVVLLESEVLLPGETGLVQLRLESPGVAAHRDRFVLRRYSPAQTLGGGAVLDPRPVKHRRHRTEVSEQVRALEAESPEEVLEGLLRAAGAQVRTARDLAHVLGMGVAQVEGHLQTLLDEGRCTSFAHRGSACFVHASAWESLRQAVLAALAGFHRDDPLKTGIGREELRLRVPGWPAPPVYEASVDQLLDGGQVRAQGPSLGLAGHRVELTSHQEALREAIGLQLRAGRTSPPDLNELPEAVQGQPPDVHAVVDVMQAAGELVRLGDVLLFDPGVLQEIEADLVQYLTDHGEIEVSAFRELLGTSRKYALPLLNHFDNRGVTRRDGAVRRLVGS